MPLSVSRIVEPFEYEGDKLLKTNKGEYIAPFEVLDVVHRLPKGVPYKVVYTLDDRGIYLAKRKTIMVVINTQNKREMSACWLPNSWDGRKLRRKIVLI